MSSETAVPETAIQAVGLGKAYPIFRKPQDRLKQMICRGRRKYYDEYWALRGIDLTVAKGETVGIIGRNGSGKSTFLQLVCGTLTPTCGSLTVNGRIAALLELGAGFNPEFSGRENVYLAASVLGLSTEQIDERYASIADFAGIGDFIEQPVKLYSSGMYARLAFAVAAHVDADIMIVDEILAVGDAAFTQKCMRFIHKFRETGTLFFVSHDTSQVVSLCNRAVWLENGEVREIGTAKDVCYHYIADLHSERDTSNSFRIGGSRTAPAPATVVQDPRDDVLKSSQHRNTIEIFEFNDESPWYGVQGARIVGVELLDPQGNVLPSLDGGEEVVLKVTCQAEKDLFSPIIGFYIKDRLGQNLFGDNTYLSYAETPVQVAAGQAFAANFRFQMPYLPVGDFAVVAAIAEGTQIDHVQHHWVDDALFFRVHSSHVSRGLVGIPMHDIAFEVDGAHQPGHAP
jgi:ABC-type polysaccharide/polyol phosphate transport system, ATPase component